MFSGWKTAIVTAVLRIAVFLGITFKIKEAEGRGEDRQELRNRRKHDDSVKRSLDARRRALREFDERMRESGESPSDSGD